jgi:hypothetical protein
MTTAEALYHKIAADIPLATKGKMFGALCLKAPNGKAGVMFKYNKIILKLEGPAQYEALALPDAQIFTPMEGRPMNGWVQLGEEHAAHWARFAHMAMEATGNIQPKATTKKAAKV